MHFAQSLILGATQGITEFLPISSSAHLVIVPYLFKWPDQGLVFDVALHFGTLLAIIIYFWKDWISIIARAMNVTKEPKNLSASLETGSRTEEQLDCHCEESATRQSKFVYSRDSYIRSSDPNKLKSYSIKPVYPKNLLWIILIATIPGAIAGILLENQAETIFRNPLLIAINLVVFGIIMWLADKYSTKSYKLKAISYKLALFVGIAQMLAIVPGVSRSGSTMTAGRLIGLNRSDSARFSFLLAAPIMLGSALFEARHLSTIDASFYIGIITSFVFGLIAIKFLLQYLQKGSFAIFTCYRVILAIIVIVVFYLR